MIFLQKIYCIGQKKAGSPSLPFAILIVNLGLLLPIGEDKAGFWTALPLRGVNFQKNSCLLHFIIYNLKNVNWTFTLFIGY